MLSVHKIKVLKMLEERFGVLNKMVGSQSLFTLGNDAARIYIRYSKLHHDRGRAFFGLRELDLQRLEGHNAFICFLSDIGLPPVFIPYSDFEEIFHQAEPAKDGQYKVQIISQGNTLELYVSRQGRFNIEGYVGLDTLTRSLDAKRLRYAHNLSHSQVQTLLSSIGHLKNYEVYVPEHDLSQLDWTLTKRFVLRKTIPEGFRHISNILSEIDVIWITSGRNAIEALFEVEHSTPIYSGLLRFNDVLLTEPRVSRFTIVSNDTRRGVFSRQLFRPTFVRSGLAELTSFLEYGNVFDWYERLAKGGVRGQDA